MQFSYLLNIITYYILRILCIIVHLQISSTCIKIRSPIIDFTINELEQRKSSSGARILCNVTATEMCQKL